MNTIEFIRHVETSYDVASIRAHGQQLWPFLRQLYFFSYHRKHLGLQGEKKISIAKESRRALSMTYGLRNWFRTYNFIFFSVTETRKFYAGKYREKNADTLLDVLGRNQALTLEHSEHTNRYRLHEIPKGPIISNDIFAALAMAPIPSRRLFIEKEKILQEINQTFALTVPYRKYAVAFFRAKKTYCLAMKRWKPQALFLICYYSLLQQAAIGAAHQLGIPSIELQHGRITDQHSGAMVFLPLERTFFPDYFFCYGHYVKTFFEKGTHLLAPNNVFPVGSAHLEYINQSYDAPEQLKVSLCQYKRTVAITSQWSVEPELVEFIKQVAVLDANTLYIFIPRNHDPKYQKMGFPANVVFFPDLDFYQICKFTDFHATVCSTCALEAPALGTPNILLNIKNWSVQHYAHVLTDAKITRRVESPLEMVELLRNWTPLSRNEIKRRHQAFYTPNHRDRLTQAVREIFENEGINYPLSSQG